MTSDIAQGAPIGLFIYKRPEHTRRALVSLLSCEGADSSRIYVFADGPKSEAEVDAVHATRAVAHQLLGPRATFVEQERNRGLAKSIIAGTTELCESHGSGIIIEDDLVVAPSFLRFLNEGLERYREDSRVMQISGHMFDVPAFRHRQEALLLPMTTSWGWATWKRAWTAFDPSATGWRERLSDALEAKRFNLDGRFAYVQMLRRQMNGEIDSWAIRWYYTVFAHDGLALFPPRTLVVNMGLDGSGTHHRLGLRTHQAPLETGTLFDFPTEVADGLEKVQVFDAVGTFRPSSAYRRLFALAKVAVRRWAP